MTKPKRPRVTLGADYMRRRRDTALYNARVRAAVFDHYGWSCACCGVVPNRPEIDHIDGKGREHRIELFGTNNAGGPRFYTWLRKNGFPEGFQTLCPRCNRWKGATDTCPLHPRDAA